MGPEDPVAPGEPEAPEKNSAHVEITEDIHYSTCFFKNQTVT